MLVPPPPPPVVLLPPQARTPLARLTRSNNIPITDRQRRHRAGIPKSRIQANVALPVAYQGAPGCAVPGRSGYTNIAEEAAVVEMVSVAVPALALVMLTGVVELKLRVGGYWAPAGLDVMLAASATLPVKPPLGVTLIVEVFPAVAPRETVTDVPPMVKPDAPTEVVVKLLIVPLVVPALFWATTLK